MPKMIYEVNLSFELTDEFAEHSQRILKIGQSHLGECIGSGAGCGFRDMQFVFARKKERAAFIADLEDLRDSKQCPPDFSFDEF
jgi:hypothetical protein